MQENHKFIKCDCYGHALEVESEYLEPGRHLQFYLSFWNHSQGSNSGNLWHRIKLAFRLVFKGTLYTDMICLDKESASELYHFLGDTLHPF